MAAAVVPRRGVQADDPGPLLMRTEDLDEQERALLDSIAVQLWKARREGAVVGGLYALSVVSLLYSALVWLGPTHAVSAACYGGVVVVVLDGYRRLFKKP
jgi:2-methylcitrate dehydratase PrpD